MPVDTSQLAIIAAVVLAVVLVAVLALRSRRRAALRKQFGPLYASEVERLGTTKAERELDERARRFEQAQIRALSQADRERYLELWRGIQARFVDSPVAAVGEAEFLVQEVMRLRGYPTADKEQRLADVAVGHPHLLEHYKGACEVTERSRLGRTNTEDMRQALVHYRALVDELLDVQERVPAGVRH